MGATINNFTEKEIFELYAFLEAYEYLCKEQEYMTNKALFEKHPELKELENIFPSINYSNKKNSNQIDDVEFIEEKDKRKIYGIKHGTNLLSILYHLRNAIAHGNIRKEGARLYLEDKTKRRPQKLTSKGYVQSMDIVNSLTNILNRIKK